VSTCNDCQGTIKWVTLDSGKPMPVEPHPSPDRGNVAAERGHDGRLRGYVMSAARPLLPGYERYVPHFKACRPNLPKVTISERTPALF